MSDGPLPPTTVHVAGLEVQGARPRKKGDGRKLATWDRYMRLPIVLAALLPLVMAPGPNHWLTYVLGIGTWLVFVADFVVHERLLVRYTSTWLGRFDLAIVILTSPWYLIPGVHAGSFIVILRLARLGRALIVVRGARRLFQRIGRVAIFGALIVVSASAVAYSAEEAVNPEFSSFGTSLWWGYVTLTTVGYGDIVPVTDVGRWASVVIMTTGIAILGVLSGSLASFFRITPQQDAEDEKVATEARRAQGEEDDASAELPAEVQALPSDVSTLTQQIGELRAEIRRLSDQVATLRPTGGADQAGGASQTGASG
ncbi:MAG: ion transporter [Candidatus Nanopelagicales bacterium]